MESRWISTNPFLMDVRDTDMDPVNHMDGRYADGTNPFTASMELTLAADGGMVHGQTPSLNRALPPTPPPSRLTNPFNPVNCTAQNLFAPAHLLSPQFTSTPFPPSMPQPVERYGVISYEDNYAPHRDQSRIK